MEMLSNLFVTLLCITFIPGLVFGIFWYLATKKGWNTLKVLALGISILLTIISFILWIATQDNWILIGGIVISLIQGIIILNWPTLASKTIKRLNLRK